MTVSHSAININKIFFWFRKETDEVNSILNPNFPGILCFFEHHLSQFEMNQISPNKYKLGTNYFTQFISNCGVCIFVHNSIKNSNINLQKYIQNKNMEICTIKSECSSPTFCIISIYRAASDSLNKFVTELDIIIQTVLERI